MKRFAPILVVAAGALALTLTSCARPQSVSLTETSVNGSTLNGNSTTMTLSSSTGNVVLTGSASVTNGGTLTVSVDSPSATPAYTTSFTSGLSGTQINKSLAAENGVWKLIVGSSGAVGSYSFTLTYSP